MSVIEQTPDDLPQGLEPDAPEIKTPDGGIGPAVGALAEGAARQTIDPLAGIAGTVGTVIGSPELVKFARAHTSEALEADIGKGLGGTSQFAMTPEAQAARAKANPVPEATGELLGLLGLGKLTGAFNFGAEGAVMKSIAQAASQSAFAAGQQFSEDALGDHNLVAQSLFAHIGLAVAAGVGGEVIGGLAGKVLPKALDAMHDSGAKISDILSDAYSKGAGAASGKEPGVIRNVLENMGEATKPGALEFENAQDAAIQHNAIVNAQEKIHDLTGHVVNVDQNWDEALHAYNTEKRQEWRTMLKGADPTDPLAQAHALHASVEQQIEVLRAGVDKGKLTQGPAVERLAALNDEFADTIVKLTEKAIKAGGEPDPESFVAADTLAALDTYRQDLDKQIPYKRLKGIDPLAADTINPILSIRRQIEATAENPGTFGDAALRHHDTNDAIANALQSREDLLSARGLGGADERIRGTKLEQFIRDSSLDKERGQEKLEILNNYIQSMRKVGDQMKITYANFPEKAVKTEALTDLMDGMEDARQAALKAQVRARELIPGRAIPYSNELNALGTPYGEAVTPPATIPPGYAQQLASLRKETGGVDAGAMGIGLAAHAAGAAAPPILAAGALFKAFTDPAKAIETIAALRRAAGNTGKIVKTAVAGAMGLGLAPAAKAAAERWTADEVYKSLDLGFDTPNAPNMNENIERTKAGLQQLGDPARMLAMTGHAISGIAPHAPKTATAVAATTARAITYLNQMAPRDPTAGVGLQQRKPRYNEQQAHDFAQDILGAAHPHQLIRQLGSGSASPRAIKAFRTVHPDLHAMISGELTKSIADADPKPSYQRLLAVSRFMGTPVGPTVNILAPSAVPPPPQQSRTPARAKLSFAKTASMPIDKEV